MKDKTRTITSSRTYGYGANKTPLWSLSFEVGTSPEDLDALDRAFALHDDARAALLWRGSRSLLGKPVQRKIKLTLPLRSLSTWSLLFPSWSAGNDVELALLSRSLVEWQLSNGAINLEMSLAFPHGKNLADYLAQWMEPQGNVVGLVLQPEGFVLDLTKGWPYVTSTETCRILLTSDESGALVLVQAEDESPGSDGKRLLGNLIDLARLRSSAHWCDWSWQRLARSTDVRVPVKIENGRLVRLTPGIVWLAPDLMKVELRDQAPGAGMSALSRMEVEPQRIEVAFRPSSPTEIERISLSRSDEVADPALEYHFNPNGADGSNEWFEATALEFRLDPIALRSRLQSLRSDGTVRRGFIPVDQGWAQVDLPVGDVNDAKGRIAPQAVSEESVVGDGALEIGTRRPERETDREASKSLPWSMRLSAFRSFSLTFKIDAGASRIRSIDGKFGSPSLSLRGLVWMAVGRPDDDDLLPRLELGTGSLRDLVFVSGGSPSQERLASCWNVKLQGLRVNGSPGTSWPTVDHASIELGDLRAPPVLWTRHPTLPAVLIQPLTAAREAVTRPLASRELLPLRLGEGKTLVLKGGRARSWPSVELSGNQKTVFWWPAGAPQAGGARWPEDPEDGNAGSGDTPRKLERGFALAALSVPGVEFWTSGRLGQFLASLRLDLPYCDEFHASAKPPRQDEEPQEQAAPVTPDLALGADEAVRRVWLGRHDACMLSLGRGTVLVDRSGNLKPDVLLPGFQWNGSIFVDSAVQQGSFGTVSYSEGTTPIETAQGARLLRGLSKGIKLNGGSLSLQGDVNDPQMVGFAMPLLKHDNKEIDGDGTRVEGQDGDAVVTLGSDKYLRLTLDSATEFNMPGDRHWRFWCRELPGRTGSTFAFDRGHWPDGATPWALAGFEWRLYEVDSEDGLCLGSDLIFQPLALQTAKRESGSWSLVVRGRVRPSLRTNGSPVPDLGEVTVTLEQNRNDGALANVVVDGDLIWPLDGLDAGPEVNAAVAARQPWLELTLDDSARFDKAILNVPILGKWRRLALGRLNEGDEGLRFSTPTGTVSGKLTATLQLHGGRPLLDVEVALDAGPIQADIRRLSMPDQPVGHTVELKRFPGISSRTPVSFSLTGFDLLTSRGLALVYPPKVEEEKKADYSVAPGLVLRDASQRWWLGFGLDIDDSARVPTLTNLYLEGSIVGEQDSDGQERQARVDLLLTQAPSSSKQDFCIRIFGDWVVDSVIRWPKVEIDNRDRVRAHLPERRSRMRMHWQGEVLEGSKDISFDEQGRILLKGLNSPPLLCTHQFHADGEGETVVSFKALHPVFIGSLGGLKDHLQTLGKTRLPQLFEAKDAASRLCGLVGSHFTQGLRKLLEDKRERDRQPVVVAAPTLCVEKIPGVLAVVALPDASGQAEVENGLSGLLNWSPTPTQVQAQAMETWPRPVDRLSLGVVAVGSDVYERGRSALSPIWASLEAGRVPRADVDVAWVGVHQQLERGSGQLAPYATDKPLLRSMIWLSKLLDRPSESPLPSEWLSTAVTEGSKPNFVVFDASAMPLRAAPHDAFAAAPPLSDLVVAGEHGMARLTAASGAVDEPWIAGAIASRAGTPVFALRRRLVDGRPAAEPINLPTPDVEPPAPVARRAWSSPDPELGPARAPIERASRPAAASLHSLLLHRRPVQLYDVSATRHQYRGPRMAGSGKRERGATESVWRHVQDDVLFAAPRPAFPERAVVRSNWPAMLDVDAEEQESNGKEQTQYLAHPYVETVSFAQRCGIFRTHREGFVLEASDAEQAYRKREVGRSMARAFRAPRPVALPKERQCRGVLWPDAGFDCAEGVADVGLVPEQLLSSTDRTSARTKQSEPVHWWPTRFTMIDPVNGVLRSGWGREFLIAWEQPRIEGTGQQRSVKSDAAWEWNARLVFRGIDLPLVVRSSTKPDEPFVLRPVSSDALSWPVEGEDLHATVILTADQSGSQGGTSGLAPEPAVTVTLPVVLVPERQFALPMRARTVTFSDPVFDAVLGSEVAASGSDKDKTRLLLDRQTYNTTGSMVLMVRSDRTASDLTIRRVRRDARTGVPRSDELGLRGLEGALRVECNRPVRLELGNLIDKAASSATDVLSAGDLLQIEVTIGGEKSSLFVAIASAPVLPAPEAAYALWRMEDQKRASCPLYGLGVMPDRVELLNPAADLLTGRVRRRAKFRWIVNEPCWGEEGNYFVQRVDHSGATHFPAVGGT